MPLYFNWSTATVTAGSAMEAESVTPNNSNGGGGELLPQSLQSPPPPPPIPSPAFPRRGVVRPPPLIISDSSNDDDSNSEVSHASTAILPFLSAPRANRARRVRPVFAGVGGGDDDDNDEYNTSNNNNTASHIPFPFPLSPATGGRRQPLQPRYFDNFTDATTTMMHGHDGLDHHPALYQLETQLMASLVENDQLRDELKDAQARVFRPNAKQERDAAFLRAAGELMCMHAQGSDRGPDIIQALRNLTQQPPASGANASANTNSCVLCWDFPATVVFRPCNHLVACAACTLKHIHSNEAAAGAAAAACISDVISNTTADKLRDGHAFNVIECPRCRARVDQTLYIYV